MNIKIRKHTTEEAEEKVALSEKAMREFWLMNTLDVEFVIDDLAKNAMIIFKLNGLPVKYNIYRDIFKIAKSDKDIDNIINAELQIMKDVIPLHYTKPITNFIQIRSDFQKWGFIL